MKEVDLIVGQSVERLAANKGREKKKDSICVSHDEEMMRAFVSNRKVNERGFRSGHKKTDVSSKIKLLYLSNRKTCLIGTGKTLR